MLINDGKPLALGIYDEGREIHILTEDFLFDMGDGVFIVPMGFRTDRASIPTFFSFWKEGLHNIAAVVHDYLYIYGEIRFVCGDEMFVLQSYRKEADILFFDMIMMLAKDRLLREEINKFRYFIHFVEACLMLFAVRVFGDKKKLYGKRDMPMGEANWTKYLTYEEE